MFGYIVVNRPELKIREYDRYQKYYCGLCRGLREEYGVWGQLSLSYDLTFLGILLTGLYEPDTTEKDRRCVLHPFEKKPYLANSCIAYAAHMNILLTYYKCVDDWRDEKKVGAFCYKGILETDIKKLTKLYPQKCACIKECLKKTSLLEKKFEGRKINEKALDFIAAQTGKMMGEVFAWRHDEWEQELRLMGFYLGKLIYLLDAYDDLLRDEKKHCFNPLKSFSFREDFDEWIYGQLLMLATAGAREFEKLPVLTDGELLRNIIYAGIWSRFLKVKEERQQGKRKESREG